MEKRIVVSVVRGPGAVENHMADSSALVNVNGNYLHLNEEDFLTLTRLVTGSSLEEGLSGLGAPAGSLGFDDFRPCEAVECSAGRL